MARRWHNQPPRDDFIVHPGLGVATVRQDHPDGTATFHVQEPVEGHPGLYLETPRRVTRTPGGFVTDGTTHPTLTAAIKATEAA